MVLYTDFLFLYNSFLTSYFFKLVSFTFNLVHSLSRWFTHSLISPLYRLGIVLALLMRSGLFKSFSDQVVMLVQTSTGQFVHYVNILSVYYEFYFISVRFISDCKLFSFLYVFMSQEYYSVYMMMISMMICLDIPKEICVNLVYKLFFIIKVFSLFTNETLLNFLQIFQC